MVTRFLLCSLLVFHSAAAWAQTPGAAPVPLPAQVPGSLPIPNTPLSLITNSSQWRLEQISANHLRLTGQVEIQSDTGTKFFADEIEIFTDPTLRLVATGNVVFTSPEGRISAERVEFNVQDSTGTFHQASGILTLKNADLTQFANQDPDVYFYGDTIEKLPGRSYRLTRGGFSTCVQPTPRWEVTSGSVLINLSDYAIARNVLLRVKGVPMFYLPLLYYPIKDEARATGFLLPTYGTSSLRGQSISNAFFLAIGRSQDATFFHDWFSNTGTGAGAEYRYIASAQSYGQFRYYRVGQHEATFRQSGEVRVLPAKNSYQFTGSGNQGLGSTLRLRERIDYASDITTQQLYQQNVYQASNASRQIEVGLTGDWTALSVGALYQRTETFTNSENSQLYGSSPRITAAVAPQRLFGSPIYGSVNVNSGYLPYKTLRNGRVTADRSVGRADVLSTVRTPLSRLTFLTANTSASYRTTYYTRSLSTSGQIVDEPLVRRYFSVQSQIIGPVLSKIWQTPSSLSSERMKHLIEPTFAVEYTTLVRNSPMVLVQADTSDVIIGGASSLTYGLNNRLLSRGRMLNGAQGGTSEIFTIGVEQTYYSNAQLGQYDPRYASAQVSRTISRMSPATLTTRVKPNTAVEAAGRVEYNTSRGFLQLASMGGTGRIGTDGTTTVSFSRSRTSRTSKLQSTLTSATALKFLQGRATGSYALNWDIGQQAIVSQGAAVTYMAQCCGLQIEFQKFRFPVANPNFPIPSDRRINFGFVLAGLGTFSNMFGAFGGLLGMGP